MRKVTCLGGVLLVCCARQESLSIGPQSAPIEGFSPSAKEEIVRIRTEVEWLRGPEVTLLAQSAVGSDLLANSESSWFTYASGIFHTEPVSIAFVPEMGDFCFVASVAGSVPTQDVGLSVPFSIGGSEHVLRRERDDSSTFYSWYGPNELLSEGGQHREDTVVFEELGIGGRFPPLPEVEEVEESLEGLEAEGLLHVRWSPADPSPDVVILLDLWPYAYTDGEFETPGILWCQLVDDGEAHVDVRSIWPSYSVHSLRVSRVENTRQFSEDWGDLSLLAYSMRIMDYHRRVRLHPPDTHP